MVDPVCFFAGTPDAGPCDGRLVLAHLIPRRLLRREYPHGASALWRSRWRPLARGEQLDGRPYRPLVVLLTDPRAVVWCCGGPCGQGGHHGALDVARTLRIARKDLPRDVELFASEYGLAWFLAREYGEGEPVAH